VQQQTQRTVDLPRNSVQGQKEEDTKKRSAAHGGFYPAMDQSTPGT
jgi:hypothetical protein